MIDEELGGNSFGRGGCGVEVDVRVQATLTEAEDGRPCDVIRASIMGKHRLRYIG